MPEKKYKILMIVEHDISQFVGGTIHEMEEGENLHKLGHHVEMIAPRYGKYPLETPIKMHYLPVISQGILGVLTYNFSLFWFLVFRSIFNRPSLFYTRLMSYSITPLIVGKIFFIPHILEVNGILCDELKILGISKLKMCFVNFFFSQNVKKSTGFTVTTPEHLDRIEELYGKVSKNVEVVPCGFNPDFFKPGDKELARKSIDVEQDIFTIIFVGSLYNWRGIDIFLKGLAKSPVTDKKFSFLIVGDGVDLDNLKELTVSLGLESSVLFTGSVPYEKVPGYLQAADLAVVFYKPTRSLPGDPMKIYEYFACALPVLTNNYPKYGGLVKEADAGIVIDNLDEEEITAAVSKVIGNQDHYRNLGKNGIKYALEHHTWLARAETLEAFFDRILN